MSDKKDSERRHRLVLTVDSYGVSVELLHPDEGCGEGLSHDGECVLADWVENCGHELLKGEASFTVPVGVEWSESDEPQLVPALSEEQP